MTAPAISGNVLQGDAGNNVLDSGGAGSATVSYSGAASGVNVDLGSGTATGDGNDTLVGGFATATGSAFADTLTAAPGGSTLNGGGGNDTLAGGRGQRLAERRRRRRHHERRRGRATSLDGGTGTDTLDYSSATSVVSASLAAGSGIVSYPAARGRPPQQLREHHRLAGRRRADRRRQRQRSPRPRRERLPPGRRRRRLAPGRLRASTPPTSPTRQAA